jgi:hypothetical protein
MALAAFPCAHYPARLRTPVDAPHLVALVRAGAVFKSASCVTRRSTGLDYSSGSCCTVKRARMLALRRSEVRIPSAPPRVRPKRRDFPGSEIARHFRSLCAGKRSLRSRLTTVTKSWWSRALALRTQKPVLAVMEGDALDGAGRVLPGLIVQDGLHLV